MSKNIFRKLPLKFWLCSQVTKFILRGQVFYKFFSKNRPSKTLPGHKSLAYKEWCFQIINLMKEKKGEVPGKTQ